MHRIASKLRSSGFCNVTVALFVVAFASWMIESAGNENAQVQRVARRFDALKCALRILLAACLAYGASEHVVMASGPNALQMTADVYRHAAGAVLSGLLWIVSIWLMFGIRTRIAAVIGSAFYAGLALAMPGFDSFTTRALQNMFIVALLAAPLIVAGGGRYSLVQGGWRMAL